MRRATLIALALLATGADGTQAQALSRERWASMMREVMPSAFCQERAYFRACFAQGAADCARAANLAVDDCLRQHEAQVPDTLKNPEAGSRWSRVIGACAGTLFEMHSRRVKRNSAKCNDPDAWN
ncbi:MAG: hypothetical protein OEV81_03770 [Betaproteobacteria bacterium]|nr:hypothetical protein [Betaproteobacteria bacterium]MDH5222274.1 hypothetical protein [Betaproteobacteria bacterium]MDH5351747.1 hypothetical protein [Betaproteobacteria bacterium]